MKSQFFFLYIAIRGKFFHAKMRIIVASQKVFSAMFVPEIVIRETFCQKFRVFFCLAKVSARESFCP